MKLFLLFGKWKFEEDTNRNNFYEIRRIEVNYIYRGRFWNRGGTNPTYEANTFLSTIDGTSFINVPYFEKGITNQGFIFLKILDVNEDYN